MSKTDNIVILINMLKEILQQINIVGTPARIYMQLLELGPSSARRIAESLSLPRPTVYDGLKILDKENLIVEQEREGKKIFALNDPQVLSQNIEDKISTLQHTNNIVQKIIPELIEQTKSMEPKIRFFSGKEGMWKMYREVLWNKNITISSVWPVKEVVKLFGKENFKEFHRKREQQNIWVNVVWPQNKVVDFPWLQSNKQQLREIRVMPKGITWNMGYWIFGDKVMFLSSQKELFGFIVQSKEFTELMKAQFGVLWTLSKPFKENKK